LEKIFVEEQPKVEGGNHLVLKGGGKGYGNK
jgi:hypothetical protein